MKKPPKRPIQKLATAGTVLTPSQQAAIDLKKSKLSNKISTGADAAAVLGNFGGAYLDSTNNPDEQGMVDEGTSGWSGALKGAGTGAAVGAQIGSLAGPLGTAVGTGLGTLGGGILGYITGENDAEAANAKAKKAQEEKDKINAQIAQINANQTTAMRDTRMLKDGGKVVGKGSGTSDSVSAKIKPGSFVVPAKNADKAALLRKLLLKGKSQKANLDQPNGIKVKVSNGEEIFTPEETEVLLAKGIDLNKLAPEARAELKKGGKVLGYKDGDFVKSQRDKLQAEKEAEAKAKRIKMLKDSLTSSKLAKERAIHSNLERQALARTSAKEKLAKAQREYDAVKGAYDLHDKQSGDALNRKPGASDYATGTSKPSTEKVRGEKEKILKNLQEKQSALEGAKKELDFANNEKNFMNLEAKKPAGKSKEELRAEFDKANSDVYDDVFGKKNTGEFSKTNPYVDAIKQKGVKPEPTKVPVSNAPDVVTTEKPSPSRKPPMRAKQASAAAKSTEPAEALPPVKATTSIPSATTEPSLRTPGGTSTEPTIIDPAAVVTSVEKKPTVKDPSSGFDSTSILNYGIPLIQSYIGGSNLNKLGDRPVDSLDPAWNESYAANKAIQDKANQAAQYGLSPAEWAQINNNNANLLNAGTFAAKNYAGGSAANSYDMTRTAINDAYTRNLSAYVNDAALKQNKQVYANSTQANLDNLNAMKIDKSRQLYEDKLAGWNQDVQANAALLQTGLSNVIGSIRYGQEQKDRKAREEKYGNQGGYGNYPNTVYGAYTATPPVTPSPQITG